jgi:chromosome segregation ATPase
MTKAEEIAMFRQFVEGLPADSYLAAILAGIPEEIERMIQNDWAFSLAGRVDDLLAERRKLEDEIKQLRQQATDLTQEIETLRRDLMMARMTQSHVKTALRDALNILMRAS